MTENSISNTPANDADAEEPMIFIILGEVRKRDEKTMIPFNALFQSSDDDTAVRTCLEALAMEGYEEADLHHIGNLDGQPPDEPLSSAWQAAVEGEFALVAYEGGYDMGKKPDLSDLDKPIILPPEEN